MTLCQVPRLKWGSTLVRMTAVMPDDIECVLHRVRCARAHAAMRLCPSAVKPPRPLFIMRALKRP